MREVVLHGGEQSYISRGLGRSYGDSALNRDQGVLLQTSPGSLLTFDAEHGRLACEAGISLAEIIDVFLPRGWALPRPPEQSSSPSAAQSRRTYTEKTTTVTDRWEIL